MDDSVLRRISADISTLMNAADSDENNTKLMELFYSLVEELGYEDNMIVTPGAYDENGEIVFQAAFKTDPYIDESIKVYVKFVAKGEDISQYADLVTRVSTYALGVDTNKTTYFIVCNLLSFKIYKVEPGQTSLITIDDSYEIVDMSNLIEYKYLLDILQAQEEDDPNELVPPPIKETAPPKEVKEKTLINKDMLVKIGLIVTGIILIFLVISFLFKGEDNPSQGQTSNQNQEVSQNVELPRPDQGQNNQNPNLGGVSTESYLTIKGVLDLSVSAKEVLDITLISDLEKGAIVKIGIWCGENTEYKYINVDANGQGSTSFNIPATWGDEKIAVGAYLKFNEANYVQPSAVTTKYGENGEYISWNSNTKDLICSSSTTHSNALVIALKEQAEKELAQKLATTIRKDFSTIDTRVDNFGNIKHVPLGYSFDSTNISESVNIYPMIYYSASEKTSYFYIICGYLGTQFYRFESVGFSADGYNWTYDNGSNPYKHQVVGNKKAEWVYFNSVDSNVLLNDMELFSSSNEVSLSLIGSINKTYKITKDQLAQIKQFLYIYETYYGNGTTVPKTSWFASTGTEVKLNYIQTPINMYQRGSAEITSMNNLSTEISNLRLRGEDIPVDKANTLALMNKTYRETSSTIEEKILNMVRGATATTLFLDDYETGQNYMKIYFRYKDNLEHIEAGYIPYINIYEDYSVIVPIKTINNNTTSYDEVYAKFYIDKSLYNELEIYYNSPNNQYKQID